MPPAACRWKNWKMNGSLGRFLDMPGRCLPLAMGPATVPEGP